MSQRKKQCHERKLKNECEAGGLFARFFNCKWDDVVGCHAAGSAPKIEASKGRSGSVSAAQTSEPSVPPCTVPACKSKSDAFRRVIGGNAPTGKTMVKSSSSETQYTTESFASRGECPADRVQLGNHSWTLLHTMAANYPDSPARDDMMHAQTFLTSLSHLYPCSHCAYGMREYMKDHPLKSEHLGSRAGLAGYVCALHNHVNKELGKETFPCDIKTLDARWKDGHPSCWEGY